MTERDLQNSIWRYTMMRQHTHLCPNVCCYAWESDFISVTKAGYVHEYECKITLSDFRADAKKTDKHQVLQNGFRDPSEYEKLIIEQAIENEKRGWPRRPMEWLTPENKVIGTRPNYFWYVCPEGLIQLEDVPKHAGLIYANQRSWKHGGAGAELRHMTVLKAAPLLHKEHITEKITNHIIRSFGFKYWNLRMNRSEAEVMRV